MAIMLQNSHFPRLPFNAQLSKRFLDDYLRDLDSARVYFTQTDVDRFTKDYGDRLQTILLQGNCMQPATDIYQVFRKRVETRVALAKKLLKEESFDFSKDETTMRSRKEAPWPKDEAEANALWHQQLKEAVLSENLRREMVARMAKEKGKEDPLKGERDPKERLALRYERFLHSVNDVDEEEIAKYFLSAVARAYDPHTDYMGFRDMERFKDGMKNALVGIGALLQAEEDGATKITGIVVNGPADKQGVLKLNDRIVGVDPHDSGEMIDIMFMKIDKVADLIRGKESTQVKLKIEPAGAPPGETRLVVIGRDKVELKDEQASAEMIEMKSAEGPPIRMGWITLPSFYADMDEGTTRCSVDVERILERLIKEKMDGLILDLRNDGGGSLEEVRRMTGFFINRGPVVQVKNTLGQIQVKDTDKPKPLYEGPMVVLTDKTSASASEILAGALQDYNRALIVGGSSTFGKGTVQQPMDIGRMLPFFAARERAGWLKVTIQKFYRPSGSSTQMDGVASDIVLPSLIDALDVGEEHLDHALPHDRIRKAAEFEALNPDDLFRPRIKELSELRTRANKEFSYTSEDVARAKQRIAENKVSLDKAKREQELAEAETLQRKRNAERRELFSVIQQQDRMVFKFSKLSLDDIAKGSDMHEYDPSKKEDGFMRRAKDETADLDDTPEWPSAMDPVKREGVMVLKDLIETTGKARMAGVLKQPGVH